MKLISSSFTLLFVIALLSNNIIAQAYDNPESVVYDEVNDRYLVSNKGNGDIISVPRSDPNNLSFFKAAVCASLRGITIADNTVWCAGTDNDGVRQYLYAYDLTGNYIKSILIAGGIFVNDVSAGEDGIIYLSDTGNNNIYRVNTNDDSYGILIANAGANGLLYESDKNRLLYADNSPSVGSQMSAIDLNTNTMSILEINPGPPTVVSSIDGLTVDHHGNYYVSSWSPPQVHRYNSDVKYVEVASVGHPSTGTNTVLHNGPADIFYDQVNNVLAVPNFNLNTVDFIPFSELSAEDEVTSIPSDITLSQNYPNPFNPNTTIDFTLSWESNVTIKVFDMLGRNIKQLVSSQYQPGKHSIKWDGTDMNGNFVCAGAYIVKLQVSDIELTNKILLIK